MSKNTQISELVNYISVDASSNIVLSNGLTLGKGKNSANGSTALGRTALYNNASGGTYNTAVGDNAMYTNTTGNYNTAVGYQALYSNTTGYNNTGVGWASLNVNADGVANAAFGLNALSSNTSGSFNTGLGQSALANNTTGIQNTGIGTNAGSYITTGNYNTIIGNYVGSTTLTSNVILADGQGNVRFQYNGTNTVIGQSGNVGIGSNTISAPAITGVFLHISDASSNGSIRLGTASGNPSLYLSNQQHITNGNEAYITTKGPYPRELRIGISDDTSNAQISFYTGTTSGGSERLRITNGGTVQPGANGTQDLGTSSLRWGTVYTSDLSMSNGIGDYTIVEGLEDLFLYNNKTNKVFKFVLQEVDPAMATPKKTN